MYEATRPWHLNGTPRYRIMHLMNSAFRLLGLGFTYHERTKTHPQRALNIPLTYHYAPLTYH